MSQHPPLNYEASATTTNPQISPYLPPEVSQCLKNARFLHLATISSSAPPSSSPVPHVSLMNYTFLPSYSTYGPVIIMTTNAQSLKTRNLLHNPRVSLLVHDWVSHRPPTTSNLPGGGGRGGSPPAAATRSSLASLLLNLNTSALSSISTTITGEARFLERGCEEERWCKEAHLANNTFGDDQPEDQGMGIFGTSPPTTFGGVGDAAMGGNSSCYMDGDEVRVVIVRVREGRIADWKGGVKDWLVVDDEEDGDKKDGYGRGRSGGQTMLNGVMES